jgi:hypothetical protein
VMNFHSQASFLHFLGTDFISSNLGTVHLAT